MDDNEFDKRMAEAERILLSAVPEVRASITMLLVGNDVHVNVNQGDPEGDMDEAVMEEFTANAMKALVGYRAMMTGAMKKRGRKH